MEEFSKLFMLAAANVELDAEEVAYFLLRRLQGAVEAKLEAGETNLMTIVATVRTLAEATHDEGKAKGKARQEQRRGEAWPQQELGRVLEETRPHSEYLFLEVSCFEEIVFPSLSNAKDNRKKISGLGECGVLPVDAMTQAGMLAQRKPGLGVDEMIPRPKGGGNQGEVALVSKVVAELEYSRSSRWVTPSCQSP